MITDDILKDWVKRFLKGTFFLSSYSSLVSDLKYFAGSRKDYFAAFDFINIKVDVLSKAANNIVTRQYIPVNLYTKGNLENIYIFDMRYFEITGKDFYIEIIVRYDAEKTSIESFGIKRDFVYLKNIEIVSFDYIGDPEKIRNTLSFEVMSLE